MKVHKRFLNVSAFSLIEMVIVIALLGIVVAMIAPMLSSGVRLYTTSKDLTTVTTKAVNAMTRMQKELIDAKAITQATSNRLRITNFDGNTITFRRQGANLQRRESSGFKLLLDDVSTLSFTYYDSNLNATTNLNQIRLVIINFTVSNTSQNFNLQEAVYMENL